MHFYSPFTKTNTINLQIIFIIIHLINSSSYFKAYQLANEDLLLIDQTGILVQDKSTQEITTIVAFDSTIGDLSSTSYFYDVTLSQFPADKGGLIICYVKQNLYIISNNYEKKYSGPLELSTQHVVIIPYNYLKKILTQIIIILFVTY